MTLHITALYTALLSLLAIALAGVVSGLRGKTGISIFHGDNTALGTAIRRHGNFIEYIPLALILMAMVELGGAKTSWLHIMGIVLIVSRLLHVIGLKADNAKHPLRIMGGMGTQLVMLASIGMILWNRM